ncbi:hypothetical protein KAR91_68840 [Candidatus Pacearchaeota archaeon]|nr:hypothetical protein [Candidatus Pacearchaeota archaeon]
MEAKIYSYKPNDGGIAKSILIVQADRLGPPYCEFCKVCPNRMKQLTNVDACDILTLKVARRNWIGDIKEVAISCDHMSPETRRYLDSMGPSDGVRVTM